MNKPVHVGQPILDLSFILMHEVHYNSIQPKYESKTKLCYIDKDGFSMRQKQKIFTNTLQEMQRRGLMKVDLQRMIAGHYQEESKRVIDMIKDKLVGKFMAEFVAQKGKMYAYKKLEDKCCKGTTMIFKILKIQKLLLSCNL